jgi:hypothetical protein
LDWLIDRLDRLLAGICIAVAGLAAAQVAPFAAQYIARGSAEVARAEARLADVETGLRYQTLAEQVRVELLAEAQRNLSQAAAARDAVSDTLPLAYPYALWRSADPNLRAATWNGFTPALPHGAWAIVLTVLGALIGFSLYETVKWPVVALLRAPRRRFKKRGGLI